ncbi:MAG TPA: DUF6491 family protein [Gammaproteobacteria bacterium]
MAVLAALPIVATGCAGQRDALSDVASRTTSAGGDCFTVSLARDFRYLDDQNLIVYAAGRDPYHVELGQACFGLRGEHVIALRSRTDRMCGFAGDAVIVDSGAFADRCPVLSVRRLDDDQLRVLLDEYDAEQRENRPIDVEVAELPEDEPDDADRDSGAENGGSDRGESADEQGGDTD